MCETVGPAVVLENRQISNTLCDHQVGNLVSTSARPPPSSSAISLFIRQVCVPGGIGNDLFFLMLSFIKDKG